MKNVGLTLALLALLPGCDRSVKHEEVSPPAKVEIEEEIEVETDDQDDTADTEEEGDEECTPTPGCKDCCK